MLSYIDSVGAGNQHKNTYISNTLQNLGSSNAIAHDSDLGGDVVINGSSTLNSMTSVTETWPDQAIITGLPQTILQTETGYNAYITWGYWTQPTIITDGTYNYAFLNKGYYVMGDFTATMPTSISGTYSGIANGTVWNTGNGTDMSGTFSMNVNFAGGTGTINAFNVSIGGGNTTINGGSGTIKGNSFSVTDAPATVNGMPGGTGSAYGSFYSPTGAWVGGVWQAENGGSLNYANGNFIGSKL